MSTTIEDLRTEVREYLGNIGDDLDDMIEDAEIDRWINRGLARLEYYVPSVGTLTWALATETVNLPSDFAVMGFIVADTGCSLEPYQIFGDTLIFLHPDGAQAAGTATLRYWAYHPSITATQDTTIPNQGDEALVYYALHRFFRRLSSTRSDYRRYATLAGQNGVDIEELDSVSQRFLSDFLLIKDELAQLSPGSTYYGD